MANGLVFSIIDWHIYGHGDPEYMRSFISVSSSFYPELTRYFEETIGQFWTGA